MVGEESTSRILVPAAQKFLWTHVSKSPSCLIDTCEGIVVASGKILSFADPLPQTGSIHANRWSACLSSGNWCLEVLTIPFRSKGQTVCFKPMNRKEIEVSFGSVREIALIAPHAPAYSAKGLRQTALADKIKWEISGVKKIERQRKSVESWTPVVKIGEKTMEMRLGNQLAEAKILKSPFPISIEIAPEDYSILWDFVLQGDSFSFSMGTAHRPCGFLRGDSGVFFLPLRKSKN